MSYAANIHVAVYQVLDNVLASSAVPPGTKSEIHSIIDVLRSVSASRDLVTMAEEISLLMHQMETALMRGDNASEMEARTGLKATAAAWLNYRLLN